jgi:transcriptional regulator with XRE-family HTH domain
MKLRKMTQTDNLEIKENEMDLVQKVAALIKRRREELGIGQALLSKLSGVERANISRIERGKRPGVTFVIVVKLFTALKIDFAAIDDL